MNEPLRQFIVYAPEAPSDQFTLKVFVEGSVAGRFVASHRNIRALHVAIPTTHVKADVPVEAPMVEVWIDKRVAPGFGGDAFVHV